MFRAFKTGMNFHQTARDPFHYRDSNGVACLLVAIAVTMPNSPVVRKTLESFALTRRQTTNPTITGLQHSCKRLTGVIHDIQRWTDTAGIPCFKIINALSAATFGKPDT